jgi:hypothetical protein
MIGPVSSSFPDLVSGGGPLPGPEAPRKGHPLLRQEDSVELSSVEKTRQDDEKTERQTELSSEETKQVAELRARDREVRQHEQAHKAAAGQLAQGGPSYTYETGPDGRRYAVGGEVQISLREGRTPEETMRLARQAQAAANAPAEPSSQDRRVAAEAAAMAAEAQAEVQKARKETDGDEGTSPLEKVQEAYAESGRGDETDDGDGSFSTDLLA